MSNVMVSELAQCLREYAARPLLVVPEGVSFLDAARAAVAADPELQAKLDFESKKYAMFGVSVARREHCDECSLTMEGTCCEQDCPIYQLRSDAYDISPKFEPNPCDRCPEYRNGCAKQLVELERWL